MQIWQLWEGGWGGGFGGEAHFGEVMLRWLHFCTSFTILGLFNIFLPPRAGDFGAFSLVSMFGGKQKGLWKSPMSCLRVVGYCLIRSPLILQEIIKFWGSWGHKGGEFDNFLFQESTKCLGFCRVWVEGPAATTAQGGAAAWSERKYQLSAALATSKFLSIWHIKYGAKQYFVVCSSYGPYLQVGLVYLWVVG
jgi:hypothetical protein